MMDGWMASVVAADHFTTVSTCQGAIGGHVDVLRYKADRSIAQCKMAAPWVIAPSVFTVVAEMPVGIARVGIDRIICFHSDEIL